MNFRFLKLFFFLQFFLVFQHNFSSKKRNISSFGFNRVNLFYSKLAYKAVVGREGSARRVNFHESHKFSLVGNSTADSAEGEIHVTHISTKKENQNLDRNHGSHKILDISNGQ